MSELLFQLPYPSVAIAGMTRRFPVRRILCVGRNYAAHAREMGDDLACEPPFFFFKPSDAVVDDGSRVRYPPLTAALHHEVELVVAIGREGADVEPAEALSLVFGYAVGLDLTRRDLQDAAKALRRPWDWAKGFDGSAPCGAIRRVAEVGHPSRGRIWLDVNEVRRQEADLGDLIWAVPEVISVASQAMTLEPGDLIFTGTPSGVGPAVVGDRLRAGIDGVGEMAIELVG